MYGIFRSSKQGCIKSGMESLPHIKNLGQTHIECFNYIIEKGLQTLISDIEPLYLESGIKIYISSATMERLRYPMDTRRNKRTVYPSEARLRAATYLCELHLELCVFNKDTLEEIYCIRTFYLPVMVKSKLCYTFGFNDNQLIKVKEDINDPGGYFIVSGKERIIRNFTVPRRNYPLALADKKWKNYGENYSDYGILVRCVKDEHLFSNISLHYVTDGSYEIRLYHNNYPYYIPVMLLMKALVDKSDYTICKEICKYERFPLDHLKHMLRTLQFQGIHSHLDAKNFLGKMFFRVVNLPPDSTYQDAADFIFRKSILIHLDDFQHKFEFLCFSLCKLYSVTLNKCRLDDIDNPAYQEILTSGQTYLIALKLGIIKYLNSVKNIIIKDIKDGKVKFERGDIQKYCNRAISFSPQIKSMIATGNFPHKRMHGLPTNTGFTIAVQRTNIFELAAQFSAVCKFSLEHYGKNMRKYYPESWGYLCPTQTPEGENIGLYNHLASHCQILPLNVAKIEIRSLFRLGVLPCSDPATHTTSEKYFVFVDGVICGWIYSIVAEKFLLHLKDKRSENKIPSHAEIVIFTKDQHLFPAIYLFSTSCRLVRKIVKNSKEEYIGILEQAFLEEVIEIFPHELDGGTVNGYSESRQTNFLSLSAAMIPFLEYNAAVRNIFSSVKCKQALGVPFWNFVGRSDSKTHHLIYSQSPVVMTREYADSGFQHYPHGTNVILAVISYSGFDMEDALVLNKSSVERGLMDNMVYKTVCYDFEDLAIEAKCNVSDMEFKIDKMDPTISYFLDKDGLPYVGSLVKYNDPILSIYNKKSRQWLIKRYLERHKAYIYSVKFSGDVPCSSKNVPKSSKKIFITFCVRRAPKAGDKFSNRHGGKGICSFLMPVEDLPFSADGIVPDVLFNPHGLPSRMSIGMLYEMMAAKASGSKGAKYIVDTFSHDESKQMYETVGEALVEAGFSYKGTETFYSGISGEELQADVFCGSMYYFRLHHLVEEKYQVRSVGPVDERTLQPINPGKSGAIRFGEMEKDAILSHGAIELMLDRLLINSDKCYAFLCQTCHVVLYPILQSKLILEEGILEENIVNKDTLEKSKFCDLCQKCTNYKIRIPYVLIYLLAELSVMGIKFKLSHK